MLKPAVPNFDQKKLPPQVRQLTALYYKIGYHFVNINLPILALMHRSYDPEHNYERLEFLGDALLGMIIAETLFLRHADQDEGQLTRMRASLVKEPTLAIIASQLSLPNYVILGVGERKGGGRQRASILADTVESLIGAIYLDSGSFEITKNCVLDWYGDLLDTIPNQTVLKDAKSRLQELLQAHQLALPQYEVMQTIGNAPNQTFVVKCVVAYLYQQELKTVETTAKGESRRIAEQRCADAMLATLLPTLTPLK